MDLASQTAAVRQFNRTYTRHVGVVNGKSLPKGYNLAELHVLHAIAHHPGITARKLAAALSLDHGYLSRIINGLSNRRFLKRERDIHDKRQMHLSLSRTGLSHFEQIEGFANRYVERLLEPMLPAKRDAMIRAMGTILSTLQQDPSAPVIFRQMKLGDAGKITEAHGKIIAPEFGWDTRFEALCARILADFIDHYQPEWERSFIVERNGEILGSLFVVRQDAGTAKLRLLYVDPAARGMGLATKLMDKAIGFARSKHYKRVTLFTTSNNLAARRIYTKMGFALTHEEPHTFCGQDLTGETWELML